MLKAKLIENGNIYSEIANIVDVEIVESSYATNIWFKCDKDGDIETVDTGSLRVGINVLLEYQ